MAVYIAIRKVREDLQTVEYAFGVNETDAGRIRVEKTSGDISLVQQIRGDPESRIAARAMRKLKKHWEANEYPDQTCWAS